jgi:hypothetical protein
MVVRELKISDLVLGLGFSVAAGCLIGVLYAPQAGRRTRRQLVSAMEDGADYVISTAEGYWQVHPRENFALTDRS